MYLVQMFALTHLELMKERFRPQHEMRGTDQAQFSYKRHNDWTSEPVARDERDVSEPVPDVWHLSIRYLPDRCI